MVLQWTWTRDWLIQSLKIVTILDKQCIFARNNVLQICGNIYCHAVQAEKFVKCVNLMT